MLRIGDLANICGISVESLRFYEREGLLSVPARSNANYRLYDQDAANRVAFILKCRALDMALDEIRVLLSYKNAPQEDCAAVNALLDEHIGHVEFRIKSLRQLKKQLEELRHQCQVTALAADCGILQGLSQPPSPDSEIDGKTDVHVGGSHRGGRTINSKKKVPNAT